ncbi:3972_t:CDS:2, partial [Dentiscutata erythropus]
IKHNDILKQLLNLPDYQIFDASTLLQTMTYSRENRKEEIISAYLQKKACEFIGTSFYKHDYTINILKSKIKKLKQKNRRLKRLKSESRLQSSFNTHSLSMKIARSKQSKQKQVSKIWASVRKAKKICPVQFQCLQYCLENIYELFGNELNDAKCELNAIDFENFHTSLYTGIESTLNGFIKWMKTWIHLPLSVCRLGGVNGPEFACTFLIVFFNKNFLKAPTPKEISYIKLLKEDLSSGCLNTFGLLKALAHHDFFEEFEAFAGSDESRIQLSGLDSGVQKISQDILRSIRKEINNSKGTKQLELESVEFLKKKRLMKFSAAFLPGDNVTKKLQIDKL